jgi:hypothetical protein
MLLDIYFWQNRLNIEIILFCTNRFLKLKKKFTINENTILFQKLLMSYRLYGYRSVGLPSGSEIGSDYTPRFANGVKPEALLS